MSRFKNILTGSIVAVLMFTMMVPPASAATTAELQAMITTLMAQIAALGTPVKPMPVLHTVPEGVQGGSIEKFAQIKQVAKELVVGEDTNIVSAQMSPNLIERNLNKVVLRVSPKITNQVQKPWLAFDDLVIKVNGYSVRVVDVANQDLWRQIKNQDNKLVYDVTVYTGNIVLPAKSAPKVSVSVETSKELKMNGDMWLVWVPQNGITTWNKTTKNISYGPSKVFNYRVITPVVDMSSEAHINDILVTKETTTAIFRFNFEVTAIDTDIYVDTGAKGPLFTVTGPGGVDVTQSASQMVTSSDRKVGESFIVEEGETEEFTLTLVVPTNSNGSYFAQLKSLSVSKTPLSAPGASLFDVVVSGNTISPKVLVSSLPVVGGSTSTVAQVNSFQVNPSVTQTGSLATLAWSTRGTDRCSIFDATQGVLNLGYVRTGLPSNGTYQVIIQGKEGSSQQIFLLRCHDASTLKDKVVEAQVVVKFKDIIVPPVPAKPTPRFNGMSGGATPTITISAVFGKPVAGVPVVTTPVKTSPVKLGTVTWGDGVIESVSGLVTGDQTTVNLKHTYKRSGTYKVVLTNLTAKSVSESVTVVVPPVMLPKPAAPATSTSTPTPTPTVKGGIN